MTLQETIFEAYKTAMKEKLTTEKTILNYVVAAFKNKKIELQKEITDEDVIQILKKEIKTMKESCELLEKAGKLDDLAEEKIKIETLQIYLPATLNEAKTRELVQNLMMQLGLTEVGSNKGRIIGEIMKTHKTEIDGQLLNQILGSL